MAPAVKLLMLTTGIITYPIARALDITLGEHDVTRYKNDQLKRLVQMHSRQALEDLKIHQSDNMGLTMMQSKIISNAFDLRKTTISEITTTFDKVFCLSIDTVMN